MNRQGDSILDVQAVVKDFGGLRAINRVSLQIAEGEIRGLIGPNASGKTTLINLISGMVKADEGRISFAGRRIEGLEPDEIASLGVIFRNMTVLENVMVPALAQGQELPEARRRAEDLLDFALLTRLREEPARNLSGGQAMLLQIVRGFIHQDLHLYLMDEPFAGVHDAIKGVILKTIKVMNEERRITFLIVSHEMTTISSVCHQVTVLDKGEVISQGTMEQVANDPVVIDSYLGG
jgi:branched-chain amino acid transport system ATP-binding protein